MAIAFARLEIVKRSSGKNICAKSAYNSRDSVPFHGTNFQPSKTYDWSYKVKPAYSSILLPEGVDEKYQSKETLWNAVEGAEKRKDSQVAMELVLALPDEKTVSVEQKIELARSFVEKHFVKDGLAVQIDVHVPDDGDHNWHAHILIPTRRFTPDGKDVSSKKALDVMPVIKKGKVISGKDWGKLWGVYQTEFFKSKGIDLTVDTNGVVPQIHLGPVRMRGQAHSLFMENESRVDLAKILANDPDKVVEKLTETQSVFKQEDVEKFFSKFIDDQNKRASTIQAFWESGVAVQLHNPKSGSPLDLFTAGHVYKEERQIIKLSEYLISQKHLTVSWGTESYCKNLTSEQKQAFHKIVNDNSLSLVEGYAGTGKSYLMLSLRDLYKDAKCHVRALCPDSATAAVMKDKGFEDPKNLHRFLYDIKNNKDSIGSSEVWLVDEAGKVSNESLLETLKLAKMNKAKVVLVGCSAQLPSVARGGMFGQLCERFGCTSLVEIQRQNSQVDREIAKNVSMGQFSSALQAIEDQGGFVWCENKYGAMLNLLTDWAQDRVLKEGLNTLLIARSNQSMRYLNEGVRRFRVALGEVGSEHVTVMTPKGGVNVSVGDRVRFRENSKELGVYNGEEAVVVGLKDQTLRCVVVKEGKRKEVDVDVKQYNNLQLAYCQTTYTSQGDTVDNTYVLHSRMLSRELFVVEMTRHREKATVFVPRECGKNLLQLKNAALKERENPNTLVGVSLNEMQNLEKQEGRQEYISELRTSGSVWEKLLGNGLKALDRLKGGVASVQSSRAEVRANKAFYSYSPRTQHQSGTCNESKFDENFFNELSKRYEKIIAQQEHCQKIESTDVIEWSLESYNKGTMVQKKNLLTKEQRSEVSKYFDLVKEVSDNSTILVSQQERVGKPREMCPGYLDWKQSCIARNAQAFNLTRCTSPKNLKSYLGEKSYKIVCEKSDVHKRSQESSLKSRDLEERIKDDLESFLFRLFPEGPTGRDSRGLRFGGKGSLSVVCSGDKKGTFFDFENKQGGGPIKLVQKKLQCDYNDAVCWVKDVLGERTTYQPPKQFSFKGREKSDGWISLLPNGEPAPTLQNLSKSLFSKYREVARHSYKDPTGNELYQTIRLVDKCNSDEKIVLPVSYGKYDSPGSNPRWAIKGFKSEKKCLYGLDLLTKHLDKTVLIVEGEKTADAANKMLSSGKYIAITWQGGSSSVGKVDWTPLSGRDVIIWPDNDKAGRDAQTDICKELNRVGVNSIRTVDSDILRRELPEKWDLADPVPEKLGGTFVKDMLMNAHIEQHLPRIHSVDGKACSLEEKLLIQELTNRIANRDRDTLEKEHGNKTWEIDAEIASGVESLLSSKHKVSSGLMERGVNGEVNKRLTNWILLQKAGGNEVSDTDVENTRIQMKELSKVLSRDLNTNTLSREESQVVVGYAFDKALADSVNSRNVNTFDLLFDKELRQSVSDSKVIVEKDLMIHNQKAFDRSSQLEF